LKVIRAKELRRGQVWLQEGAVCDRISFVVKGLLKLYFESAFKELVISFSSENEFSLSADSFFNQVPSRYTIRSIEATVIVFISANELRSLTEKFPELNLHLKCVAEQQVSAFEYHSGLLMMPPKERYEQLASDHPWMIDGSRLTDRLLAAYLGVGANAVCQWRKMVN
jgi:CRP-like cAMP-binding protein